MPESQNCSAEEVRFDPTFSRSGIYVLSSNSILQIMTAVAVVGREQPYLKGRERPITFEYM